MRELLHAAVLMVVSCIVVRWLLPTLLQLALRIVENCMTFTAACLLLPEYWLSTAIRRRSDSPPRIAYEYGDAIAGLCRILHTALHSAAHGLTIAAREVPAPFVAVLTGGIYLAVHLQGSQ
ncbi:MAG: hypothetical protein ACRDRW_18105 [Pseudonocardiaceae bacterium]